MIFTNNLQCENKYDTIKSCLTNNKQAFLCHYDSRMIAKIFAVRAI